ncbi:hypothetical protein K501DRAFT_324660 [Backusella circina FSU 941]|nr:hypothetical protein K501DRAFT_324660 [Backusella circina FSU 941]
MDVRVPTCPICQKPVPGKRGEDPNIRMNQHIQNNCADLEPKSNNTCRKKGCSTKMLVPMQCTECGLSFCVKHRLEVDHQCEGKPPVVTNKLFGTSAKKPQKQQQNNNRAEMERQRRERVQQRNQEIERLQMKVKQGKITDKEQIQLAKLLSMDPKNDEKKCIVS